MKTPLISNEMNDMLNRVSQMFFYGNSLMDNIVYNLDIIFNMPKTQDIIHHSLAHQMPLIADKFVEIQTLQNAKPSRLTVDENSKIYYNFTECFIDISNYFINKLEPIIKEAILLAEELGEIKTKVLLETYFMEINIFTKQSIIWENKALDYDNISTLLNFDNDFEHFTIIPIV